MAWTWKCGAALGLLIGEQIVAVLLLSLGLGWARTVVDFFPGRISQTISSYYNGFGSPTLPHGVLGEGRALLTLGVYSLGCLVIAFLVFRRRDIRGAA